MPTDNTELRVTAQPIHAERLERFVRDIEDKTAWVTGPLTRGEAHALAGDAMHWRAMYQDALADMVDKQSQISKLLHERGYACENPCGGCAGCDLADEDLGEGASS